MNWIVRIWMLMFCLILRRCIWYCEFGRFVSCLKELWWLDLFTMFDRLPYIVGGQSIKRVVILQNHYSIQDLLLDALLASLVLEEYSPFNWASSSGIPDEVDCLYWLHVSFLCFHILPVFIVYDGLKVFYRSDSTEWLTKTFQAYICF